MRPLSLFVGRIVPPKAMLKASHQYLRMQLYKCTWLQGSQTRPGRIGIETLKMQSSYNGVGHSG